MSDEEILLRAREGDPEAFSQLWQRHGQLGLNVARSFTSTFDPEDVVAEAYVRIYRAMQAGSGPTSHFPAYLVITVKNVARRWSETRRDTTPENFDELLDQETVEDFADTSINKAVLLQAFKSLPTRWQQVLWAVEVEDKKPSEVHTRLGLSPNATAALTYRAREGLKQAWIDAHLDLNPRSPRCRSVVKQLAAFERDALSAKNRAKVEAHLSGCASCRATQAQAEHVAGHLKSSLLITVIAGGVGIPAALSAMSLNGAAAAHAVGATAVPQSSAAAKGTTALQQLFSLSPKATVSLFTATALVSGGAFFATTLSDEKPDPATSEASQDLRDPEPEPEETPGAAPETGDFSTQLPTHQDPATAATTELVHSDSTGSVGLAAPTFNMASGSILNGSEAIIAGSARPGATVTLYLSGENAQHSVETVAVNKAGGWSFTLNDPHEGSILARAYQSDATGQRSPLSTSEYAVAWNTPTSSPVITSVDTADGTLAPIVHGTGEPGNLVQITLNEVATTKRINSDGEWFAQIDKGLLLGQNTITATQRPPQAKQQSASAAPVEFELTAPTAAISVESDDYVNIELTSTPKHHVLITGNASRFSHTVSPTTGLDSIRLFSGLLLNSDASSNGLTLRYTSEDGERLGVGATEQIAS